MKTTPDSWHMLRWFLICLSGYGLIWLSAFYVGSLYPLEISQFQKNTITSFFLILLCWYPPVAISYLFSIKLKQKRWPWAAIFAGIAGSIMVWISVYTYFGLGQPVSYEMLLLGTAIPATYIATVSSIVFVALRYSTARTVHLSGIISLCLAFLFIFSLGRNFFATSTAAQIFCLMMFLLLTVSLAITLILILFTDNKTDKALGDVKMSA